MTLSIRNVGDQSIQQFIRFIIIVFFFPWYALQLLLLFENAGCIDDYCKLQIQILKFLGFQSNTVTEEQSKLLTT